jgi:hypothetical protein
VLRAAALVSLVIGFLRYGGVAGAVFALVMGGTVVPRALAAPTALDASYSASILFAGWAAELDWYLRVGWLDVVVHAAVTGLVAAMVHLLAVRVGALPPVDAPPVAGEGLARPRLGTAVCTAAIGVTLSVWWEFGEWVGHTYLDHRIQVGYDDTIGDLAAGTVGAVVAAALLARGLLLSRARR